jgi:hypothetical protein
MIVFPRYWSGKPVLDNSLMGCSPSAHQILLHPMPGVEASGARITGRRVLRRVTDLLTASVQDDEDSLLRTGRLV